MQDPAAAIGTLGFDEAEAAKKREGLSKHQRTADDLSVLIRSVAFTPRPAGLGSSYTSPFSGQI